MRDWDRVKGVLNPCFLKNDMKITMSRYNL